MKDQELSAYFKAMPPARPEIGISMAKFSGLLEERYGRALEMTCADTPYGNRVSFLVRSGSGIIEGYFFPDTLVLELETTHYPLAFRFFRWLRTLYPTHERMYVYDDYKLDKVIEVTAQTTDEDLAAMFPF